MTQARSKMKVRSTRPGRGLGCRGLPIWGFGIWGLLPVLNSCGPAERVEIEQSRTYRSMSDPIRWNVSTGERLMTQPQTSAPSTPLFAWDLPEGWTTLPASQFRQADFRIESHPDVECYMSMVAGGALANLSRWRGQMGLGAFTAAELDELPRQKFLGQDAYYVEMEGTFAGMAGAPQEGFMLVGLVMEVVLQQAQVVTLKMIGPRAGVEAEKENFSAIAASFRVAGGPGGPGGAPGGGAAAAGAGGLTWLAPEAWQAAPTRPMTEVVYTVAEATSCWVSVLGLNAGGIDANIQRWRSQMGGAPVVAQEAIPMFDTQGSMIEIRGRFAGDSSVPAIAEATMLAASCGIGNSTVFVKMIGPMQEVQAHREEFLQFCASLGQ